MLRLTIHPSKDKKPPRIRRIRVSDLVALLKFHGGRETECRTIEIRHEVSKYVRQPEEESRHLTI